MKNLLSLAYIAAASAASLRGSSSDSPATGVSSRIRTQNPTDGKFYCLEVNGQGGAAGVRREGSLIDFWDCDLVDSYGDFLDRAVLADWWMTTSTDFQVRSIVSDLCLSPVDTAGAPTLASCEGKGTWSWSSGALSSSSGMCLHADWESPTGQGFPARLSKCGGEQISALTIIPNSLVLYPVPDLSWEGLSYKYKVKVEGRGVYVYHSEPWTGAPHFGDVDAFACKTVDGKYGCDAATRGTQWGKTIEWTTFSFDEKAIKGVEIKVTNSKSWSKCVVVPRGLNIKCERDADGDASFVLPSSKLKVSVEFDPPAPNDASRVTNVVADALMIFADEMEAARPDPSSEGVEYFGPGVRDLGCHTIAESGTEVYIAGGAYLRGSMKTAWEVNDVKIRGRGVITMEDGAVTSGGCKDSSSLIFVWKGEGVSIEGVTAVGANFGAIGGNIGGNTYFGSVPPPNFEGEKGLRVSNVKVMAWQFASDGIFVGRNGYVGDSFVRCNDDIGPDYQSGQLWENNVFWQLENGWPWLAQWNTWDEYDNKDTGGGAHGIEIRDAVLLHMEQRDDNVYGGRKRSVFGAWQGMTNVVKDVLFKNIVVEGGIWVRPFVLHVGQSPFSQVPNECCGNGSLEGFRFENIRFDERPAMISIIEGNAEEGGVVKDVVFSGVEFAGVKMTKGDVEIDAASTNGILIEA